MPRFSTIVFIGLASRLGAQQVRGVVRDSARAVPLPGTVVTILDSAGAAVGRAISDADGRFALAVPPRAAGARAVRIGYRPRDFALTPRVDTLEIAMAKLRQCSPPCASRIPSYALE